MLGKSIENKNGVPTDQLIQSSGRTNRDNQQPFTAPSLSLPKGGGAVRGIDEKLSVNAANGTATIEVPILSSPSRSGFDPKLSLKYDSGSGNGPFGIGWTLSIPSITRKTEKGLPRYADEEDIFILSGVEDLVPVLGKDDGGSWHRVSDSTTINGFKIDFYRPRIEGLLARIERWTNLVTGEQHWRSISKENITTLYGKDEYSRISDPSNKTRIFSWLICESFDDKGNAILYRYKPENVEGVDLTQLHERNRADRSANRYISRILYGNRIPYYPYENEADLLDERNDWMFELTFDYGENYYVEHIQNTNDGSGAIVNRHENQAGLNHWDIRQDEHSSYRPGFEIRTSRLCKSVKMIHHFPVELTIADYVVRATEFSYDGNPVASLLTSVSRSSYLLNARDNNTSYLKKWLPPLEFRYSKASIGNEVHEVEDEFLENIPSTIGGTNISYQWVDLDGEGLNGILAKHVGGWYYKHNTSRSESSSSGNGQGEGPGNLVQFSPMQKVEWIPSIVGEETNGQYHLRDLAGDGKLDIVQLGIDDKATSGYFERTSDKKWDTFIPFIHNPNILWNDPNLKFIDLTGDGRPDVLITEDRVFTFYKSLGEEGYEFAGKLSQSIDEEKGPRVVFADTTRSIFLANMSNDGLTDIVEITNGSVWYWPNLGYGRFGSKVTMDNSPWFDSQEQFDPQRIILSDTDGNGLTDIVYVNSSGNASIYLNQSGNSWSIAQTLEYFPPIHDLANIEALDLMGNGTACLVWSTPLPSNARRNVRYIELTGGIKPNILTSLKNNLGAETTIYYAPSTKFYLRDKFAGKPWITQLPFPVHVVEKVEIYDHISKNKFVSQYVYHHGCYDGFEREFRGFSRVDQMDTQEFGVFKQNTGTTIGNDSSNIDEVSHVPPVETRTYYHTGIYVQGGQISRQLEQDYYREPNLTQAEFSTRLLDDTVIPLSLTAIEELEACRALKGSILRTEIYANDGSSTLSDHPYVVSEYNYSIKKLQPILEGNKSGVFLVSPRETITYNYERNPTDPRKIHNLVIEVDEFGNVRKSVSIAYGRNLAPGIDVDPDLSDEDRDKQQEILATYTENAYTRLSILAGDEDRYTKLLSLQELKNVYLTPVSFETKVYELPGLTLNNNGSLQSNGIRFDFKSVEEAFMLESGPVQRNLIEQSRTTFRKNDLSGPLEFGQIDTLGLPFQKYMVAFTPELIQDVYGDKVTDTMLSADGGYVQFEEDQNDWWWIPSTKIFYSPDPTHVAVDELEFAKQHFYSPHRYEDPFGNNNILSYDDHMLILQETQDPLDNVVSAIVLDYRTLQPSIVADPNGNRAEVAFDILGFVTGTAIRGNDDDVGDSLDGFQPELEIDDTLSDPHNVLKRATSRMIYNLFTFKNSSQDEMPQPNVIATILRKTHESDLLQGQQTEVQLNLAYIDGCGREIQKKVQAEPGEVPAFGHSDQRWVGSGWTIFNNKGKPVKKYESFFDVDHHFKFARMEGISPTIFYDPIGRVIGILNPSNTFEKTLYNNWFQKSWDPNDTVLESDTRNDGIVGDHFRRLFSDVNDYESWHDSRIDGQMNETNNPLAEQKAAQKASVHAETPITSHLDSLGRVFLVIADNGDAGKYSTHIQLDIKGNQMSVTDTKDRKVVLYSYDKAGNRIRELNMDSGERWILRDIQGNSVYQWDSRGFRRHMTYDPLRRPKQLIVRDISGIELLAEETIYGESKPDSGTTNHRLKIWKMQDCAGLLVNELYDFKGNLVTNRRRLLLDYKSQVDWAQSPQPPLEDETFTASTRYDALNRPVQLIAPHSDRPGTKLNIIQYTYNDASLLERIDGWLEQDTEPDNLLDPVTANQRFVKNINYNAKGQRKLIEYGNDVVTSYEYDNFTFRLTNLVTMRGNEELQKLSYFYDPAGNITSIHDDALQTIFFNGEVVTPDAEYVYDPIYRLVEASGREHIGQPSQPHTTWDDRFRVSQAHPNDGQKMRNYVERITYDNAGNILEIDHDAANGNWNRVYHYNETSIIENQKNGDRLSETVVHPDAQIPILEQYSPYDENGNMTALPHLPLMAYDFNDRLHTVNLGGGGSAFYVYNALGQRVLKVHEHLGALTEKRIYLGDFEIFRKHNGNGLVLARESLHIVDDNQLMAIVDIRTRGTDNCPERSIRYQLGNHLGSSCLELGEEGQIMSYEEYYPYGGTSYLARKDLCDVNLRRYRYVGKERDEETGLYYFGARYYLPWLGRWCNCDPVGISGGLNLYAYSSDNPVMFSDTLGLWPFSPLSGSDPPEDTDPEFSENAGTTEDNVEQIAELTNEIASTSDKDLNSQRAELVWILRELNGQTGPPPPSAESAYHQERMRSNAQRNMKKSAKAERILQEKRASKMGATAMGVYAGILFAPFVAGELLMAEGVGATTFWGTTAAYEADALQAGTRSLASGTPTPMMYEEGLTAALKAGGASEENAAIYASGINFATGLLLMAGGAKMGSSGRSVSVSDERAPLALPPARPPRTPRTPSPPGPTVDRATGSQVGRFAVDPRGNAMIEPAGGSTVARGKGGVDTHTLYPNKSNYQRLNPQGHAKKNPTPHGHGHLRGSGPNMKGQGESISPLGEVVSNKSSGAHWPINH